MRTGVWRWLLVACWVCPALGVSAQTNGIFADFTTTLGNFTCQLDFTNSPKAVANFVGLATGERAWLDLNTGEARTNGFYDGVIFHRVITNFMDQAGSPDGLGDDGPGYAFVDQFSSVLDFSNPWVMAMANSGPNSNGSQFFVTVAPYTYGNSNYVILGRVVAGTNVVAAINHVATDSNNKPLTNVVIEGVSIRRVGSAAQAFDINAQGLPSVANVPVAIRRSAPQVSLSFTNRLYADNRWSSSTNWSDWTVNALGIEVAAPSSNTVQVAMDTPQKFFRVAQVQYSSSTLAPKNVLGRTLTMTFSGGLGINTIVFDSAGGGSYNFPGVNSGTVTGYSWSQNPYRGFLWPIQYSQLNEMTLELNFSGTDAGAFTGTVYAVPPFSVSGTFNLGP